MRSFIDQQRAAHQNAARLLLEAAPAAALAVDAAGRLPLRFVAAALRKDTEVVRRLLEATSAAALTAQGWLPLHFAAGNGSAEAVRLLLDAAPAAALTADAQGQLPLHEAASSGSAEAVRLLLDAAPAAALRADVDGWLPLHEAASVGNAEAVRLLLEAAPAAAAKGIIAGTLPLDLALVELCRMIENGQAPCLEAARLLLPATPVERALSALEAADEVALPLYADLAACTALSPEQWQRVPAPCPALGTALPAVLARSAAEAALLVGRLSAEVRQRLRTGALCMVRAQRVYEIELPVALVGQVLALAARP